MTIKKLYSTPFYSVFDAKQATSCKVLSYKHVQLFDLLTYII